MMKLSSVSVWRRSPVAADPPVDPRIAARRDAVSHDERRRRQRRTLTIGALAVVATLGAAATRTALLDVDRISVAGSQHTAPAAVADAAGVAHGDLMADLDAARAAARVEALPWVDQATVTPEWPGGVKIEVIERTPAAWLSDGTHTIVTDRSGLVLERVQGVDRSAVEVVGLPAVAAGDRLGPTALAAVELATEMPPSLRTAVHRVQLDGDELQLSLRPMGTVRLGSEVDLEAKLRSLDTIVTRVDLTCVETIDVRVPDVPVLTRDQSCERVSTEIRG